MRDWFYRLFFVFRPVVRASGWIRTVDPGGHLDRPGGMLLAANHSSFLDPWFVGFSVPRPVRYLINARWYNGSRILRWLFRSANVVPVDPEDSSRTIESVVRAVDRGDVVGIFPEGRITADGSVGRFRTGIAHMAALSGAPVIPLGVRGAFECLPRTRRVPRPVRVRVHVGEPLWWEGGPLSRAPGPEQAREFAARVEREVRALLGESVTEHGRRHPGRPCPPEGEPSGG